MNDADLIGGVLAGEVTAIARAVTRVERGGADARAISGALFARTGGAHLIGVTGAPGTGKSMLVAELAKVYRRREKRVGIIAVDPTSPFSGGALLGDRLRMQDLYQDRGVFIRSMASRGSLGGLAPATADVALVLEAAGYEIIFVETVGAGQGEVDIAKNAHTTLVVEAPGLGDEIQAIKAGILEIADILIVNKSDREGAEATAAALEMNLNLKPLAPEEWRPPVLKTSALKGEGIESAVEAIERHRAYLEAHGLRQGKERARWRHELERILSRELLARALNRVARGELDRLIERIAARQMDVYQAADWLLEGS